MFTMIRSMATTLVVSLALVMFACPPPERDAYNTVVAAKGFTESVKTQHPECADATNVTTVCVVLARTIKAKDALIDAGEVYCAGPDFETGGTCNAPAKGTPAQQQAIEKLNAAVASYTQIAADLKGVLGK